MKYLKFFVVWRLNYLAIHRRRLKELFPVTLLWVACVPTYVEQKPLSTLVLLLIHLMMFLLK